MKKEFKEKLDLLMEEFPEYYIEVWGPEDFKKFYYEISHEECKDVVTKLRQDYDPYSGTNLDFVEDTVQMVTKTGDYAEDDYDEDDEDYSVDDN